MTTEIATNAKQTRILSFAFIVALGFCVVFAVAFSALVFARAGQPSKIELQGQINPNDASVASLARLSGIGIGKAQAIVAYREDFPAKNQQERVFKDCNDLAKVKGLGRATIEKMKPWLKFD